MKTDRNWLGYVRMLKNGEFDYLMERRREKGEKYYAAFTKGAPVCIAPSEAEVLDKVHEEGIRSHVMTQLIGGNLETVTFYKPKGRGFERLRCSRF